MSRKPSRKPRPSPGTRVRIATKKAAAIGQLESAILLWFNEADPISILVLASNAEDCYHALGKKVGKPSFLKDFMDTMPESLRERAKYIQDYAKHGPKDIDEDAPFSERAAEGFMIASVWCHKQLFGHRTPLMRLFAMRFACENPTAVDPESRQPYTEAAEVYGFGSGSRKEFLDEFQSLLGNPGP